EDALREPSEVHCCLPGGVAAADDVHVLALCQRGLTRAGAVVNSRAKEALRLGQREAAVLDAGRTDAGPGNDPRAVLQVADSLAGRHLGAHALARKHDLRAELVGLLARARRAPRRWCLRESRDSSRSCASTRPARRSPIAPPERSSARRRNHKPRRSAPPAPRRRSPGRTPRGTGWRTSRASRSPGG